VLRKRYDTPHVPEPFAVVGLAKNRFNAHATHLSGNMFATEFVAFTVEHARSNLASANGYS